MRLPIIVTSLIILLQSPQPVSKLEGVVLVDGTDKALGSVQVYLFDADRCGPLSPVTAPDCQVTTARRATTDDEGKFSYENVPSGRYRIRLAKAGFAQPTGPTTLSVSGSSQTTVLRMVPGGIITGRVFDASGQPVLKAAVSVGRIRYSATGNRELDTIGPTMTNDRGEYRATGLAPGEYYIVVEPAPFLLAADIGAFTRTYFPGTADFLKAVPSRVKSAEEVRLENIVLIPAEGHTVRIHLKDTTGGGPANNRFIQLTVGSQLLQMRLDPDKTGGSDLVEITGLWPGKHEYVIGWQSANGTVMARTNFEIADSDVETELVFGVRPKISGRVVLEHDDGKVTPVEGVRVIPQRDNDLASNAVSKPDGTFAINGVVPGKFRFQFTGLPSDTYLVSLNGSTSDALTAGIDISTDTVLDVRLAGNAGAANGTITNAKGDKVPDAIVVLVPDGPLRSRPYLYRAGSTDQGGRFTVSGIAPGTYRAFAWSGLPGPAYLDPEFLRRFEDSAKPVRVDKNGRLQLELKVMDEPGSDR